MKKSILTGLQPTGELTIGNYLGSIRQMAKLQDEFESFLFVADMHALTVPQDKELLHFRLKSTIALYLACGIDPLKNTIYLQSENEYHANISWILECNTPFGELSRMTQFKDKSSKSKNFSAGLFTYPVLMAADIITYDVDFVPVGQDQKQHLELARNIAQNFNKKYGESFKVPEPFIPKQGTKIMDLIDPTKKMSKSSDNKKTVIYLLDDEKTIRKNIMGATTDSEMIVKYDVENKPGISNLLTIVSSFNDETIESIEQKFENKTYGEFKKYVADVLVEKLTDIQNKYNEYLKSDIIDKILDEGIIKSRSIAKAKLDLLKQRIGLYR